MALGNVVPLRPDMDTQSENETDTQTIQDGGYSLERKKRMFEEAEEAMREARELAFRDEDYYHNFNDDQWTEEEKKVLAERGQPTYTHNRIKRKVNFLMGMEQRGRTDPKALPRKPKSEMMAEVATDILVAIDDMTQFDQTATEGFFSLLVHGSIAVEDVWNPEEGEIESKDVPYEEFFADPRSKKHDYSDARYLGYAKWFDKEDLDQMYTSEEQRDAIQNSADKGRVSFAGYDDRPQYLYATRINNVTRVRVIVMYYKNGRNEWRLAHYVANGDLYDVPSPWMDEKNKPACGITAERLYIDRENRAYGVVRDMIGPQQEDNHYRAKIWHAANDRRMFAVDGSFGDDQDGGRGVARAKAEMAKVDGVVRPNHGFKFGEDWGLLPQNDQVQILMGLLQGSDEELNRQGPNSGLQGRGASSQSGRSRMVQQEAGMIEENNVFDRLSNWKKRSFQRKFMLARQFWQDEMYIRVTDEEDGPRFVALNKQTPGGVFNQVARLDVDITLEEMPDVANLQQEQFQMIAELLGMGIPPHMMAALIKTSQLRDKDKLVEQIMAPMQPDPQAAQAAAMELANKEAEARKTFAEVDKVEAETAKIEAEVSKVGVDTRVAASDGAVRVATAMQPQQVPQN